MATVASQRDAAVMLLYSLHEKSTHLMCTPMGIADNGEKDSPSSGLICQYIRRISQVRYSTTDSP